MNLSENQIKEMIERMEMLIAQKRMKKKDFYAASGISSSLYSQWNTGAVKPSLRFITQSADVLGVSANYLMYGKEKAPPKGDAELNEYMVSSVFCLSDIADGKCRFQTRNGTFIRKMLTKMLMKNAPEVVLFQRLRGLYSFLFASDCLHLHSDFLPAAAQRDDLRRMGSRQEHFLCSLLFSAFANRCR